jgi:superfamily II DNA or RNA helicase
MNIRDRRQLQFAKTWLQSGRFGILYLCPRFGKIYTTINILEQLNPRIRVLIAYPDLKIKKAWEEDFHKRDYVNPNVAFTTYMSLKKHLDKHYDLVVLDEIHTMSAAQTEVCSKIIVDKEVIGLTGTLSSWTEKLIKSDLGLSVLVKYPINLAIEEGILPDYEIRVVTVKLDNTIMQNFGGKRVTEKRRFDTFNFLIKKEDQPKFFYRLKIIEVFQRSLAKKRKTIELIQKYKEERLLVFCGRIDIADSLGIPSYHSKSSEKEMFDEFMEGKSKHLAVIRIGNTGVTYKPLSKVIINYADSNSENLTQKINRCMSLEYDNPEKKAIIYVITSDEDIEIKWIKQALTMFDKSKIFYI